MGDNGGTVNTNIWSVLPELQGLIMTVLFVLLGIVVIVALRKGWLKNFRAGRDGVSFDARDHEMLNKQNAYDLQVKIHAIDDDMRDSCRAVAKEIRRQLFYGLYAFKSCELAKAAVSWALYFPLQQAIDDNHLRKKLSRTRINEYSENLLREIGLEYDTFCVMGTAGCDKHSLPMFVDIREQVENLIRTQWIRKVIEYMNSASESKIKTYEEYLVRFRATADQYNIDICQVRIARNRQYIRGSEYV